MCVCVCACVRACVRLSVRACVRACVRVHIPLVSTTAPLQLVLVPVLLGATINTYAPWMVGVARRNRVQAPPHARTRGSGTGPGAGLACDSDWVPPTPQLQTLAHLGLAGAGAAHQAVHAAGCHSHVRWAKDAACSRLRPLCRAAAVSSGCRPLRPTPQWPNHSTNQLPPDRPTAGAWQSSAPWSALTWRCSRPAGRQSSPPSLCCTRVASRSVRPQGVAACGVGYSASARCIGSARLFDCKRNDNLKRGSDGSDPMVLVPHETPIGCF